MTQDIEDKAVVERSETGELMPEHREKLDPCPFCGGEAEIIRRGSRRRSTIYGCTQCSCRLETPEMVYLGDRWNTRAMPDAIPLSKLREICEGLRKPEPNERLSGCDCGAALNDKAIGYATGMNAALDAVLEKAEKEAG